MFGTAPLQNGAVSIRGLLRERGMSGAGKCDCPVFLVCRSESMNGKIKRGKDVALPEVGIRHLISERMGWVSRPVLCHHEQGSPPVSKRGLCIFAGSGASLAGISGMTILGVQVGEQVRLDIDYKPVASRIGVNMELFCFH